MLFKQFQYCEKIKNYNFQWDVSFKNIRSIPANYASGECSSVRIVLIFLDTFPQTTE